MSNCKTIAICNQKGGVMGYKMIDAGNIKDCLYSDTDYTEWYVDKYGGLRADESARKDDSVRTMLRIEPKQRRNAGRRMTVRRCCAPRNAKPSTAGRNNLPIITVSNSGRKPEKQYNSRRTTQWRNTSQTKGQACSMSLSGTTI